MYLFFRFMAKCNGNSKLLKRAVPIFFSFTHTGGKSICPLQVVCCGHRYLSEKETAAYLPDQNVLNCIQLKTVSLVKTKNEFLCTLPKSCEKYLETHFH